MLTLDQKIKESRNYIYNWLSNEKNGIAPILVRIQLKKYFNSKKSRIFNFTTILNEHEFSHNHEPAGFPNIEEKFEKKINNLEQLCW